LYLKIKINNYMAKTVYLGMIGDIMHPGLINIINEGAKYGDVMIGLFTDKAIATHKRLPYLTYEQRKNVIENIKGVSSIVPQDEWSYVPNLLKYKPDYIIHGDDWQMGPDKYIRDEVFKVMEKLGGEVIEIPYTKGISASALKDEIDSLGVTPQQRLASLRRLISAKPVVRILESHNGLTGLIAEHTSVEVNGQHREFDGMWASSLTDSTSKGKPDIEAVDLTTRLHDLNDTLEVTTKPVIYDGDTGGKLEHFVFTVRTLERLGISAVIIEDKVGLKQNSLFGTDAIQTQDTIEGFCNKIKAGKDAQITRDFMIISRCESLIAGKPVDDALERCHAYVAAGADGVMIHSKNKSGDDIKEFCLRFREKDPHTPIVAVPTTYNQFTEEELAEWGINVVIYANHMLRSAYPAMVKCAERILETSRSLEASDEYCMPIKQILNLIPGTKKK
jgi:phosphoenolpyruvate phosphomutase